MKKLIPLIFIALVAAFTLAWQRHRPVYEQQIETQAKGILKTAAQEHPELLGVTCKADHLYLTLSGVVPGADLKAMAGELVTKQSPWKVINHIQVKTEVAVGPVDDVNPEQLTGAAANPEAKPIPGEAPIGVVAAVDPKSPTPSDPVAIPEAPEVTRVPVPAKAPRPPVQVNPVKPAVPVPVKPEVAPAKPAVAVVKPEVAPAKPAVTVVKPEVAPAKPAVAVVKPEVAPAKPAVAVVKPEVAPAKPAVAVVKPEVAPAKPAVTVVQPEVAPAKPAVAVVQPEVAPAKPAVVVAKPEVAPAKPAVVVAKPEVAPAKPAVAVVKPEVAPAKPAVTVVNPEIAPEKPGYPSVAPPVVKPHPGDHPGITVVRGPQNKPQDEKPEVAGAPAEEPEASADVPTLVVPRTVETVDELLPFELPKERGLAEALKDLSITFGDGQQEVLSLQERTVMQVAIELLKSNGRPNVVLTGLYDKKRHATDGVAQSEARVKNVKETLGQYGVDGAIITTRVKGVDGLDRGKVEVSVEP